MEEHGDRLSPGHRRAAACGRQKRKREVKRISNSKSVRAAGRRDLGQEGGGRVAIVYRYAVRDRHTPELTQTLLTRLVSSPLPLRSVLVYTLLDCVDRRACWHSIAPIGHCEIASIDFDNYCNCVALIKAGRGSLRLTYALEPGHRYGPYRRVPHAKGIPERNTHKERRALTLTLWRCSSIWGLRERGHARSLSYRRAPPAPSPGSRSSTVGSRNWFARYDGRCRRRGRVIWAAAHPHSRRRALCAPTLGRGGERWPPTARCRHWRRAH